MGNLPNEKISKDTDGAVRASQYGIWQISTLKESIFDSRKQWSDIVSGASLFRRLGSDIYSLSPTMFILFMLSKIWGGIESALLMHLSSRLLRIIEVGLVQGQTDTYAVYMAIIARLASVVFVAVLQWWSSSCIPSFKTRVTYHFETYLMRARLQTDLASSQEPSRQNRASASDAWYAFEAVVEFVAELLTSASQLTLIIHASRSSGSPLFALLCMAKPIIHTFFSTNIWSQACLINATDPNYNRMKALENLSGDGYKQDYISGNIGDYIVKEYEKASKQLGDSCADEPWEQIDRRTSPYFNIFSSVVEDLPMVYCALNAIMNPSKFSITSVAVFQQSSLTLRYSMQSILYNTTSFRRQLSKIRNMYAASEALNKIQDGDIPFPKPGKECTEGMEFELRDVTFAYPGSKKTTNALNSVSLKIKAGQLVVIVGANGSGKSTIIKLLSRLYNPSSGAIIIDGIPAQDYRAVDLRKATATFTQDHSVFPLSLYENISLGYPECSADTAMVAQAAKDGGASGFIEKLTEGLRTTLDPITTLYNINIPSDPEHPLQKKMEKIQKRIDISGGERQRLVASRTFMHLNSGKVKFVAVDEPSSALDPEGEFQLFDRLISGRGGKTMVFVTHRFGHLTKYADVIICMKDGAVAESGSHEELLRVDGEYAKLYKIQADAFSSGSDPYKLATGDAT